MAKLKRILAGALSLCMVGTVLTSCGSKDDSSSGSGSTNNSGTSNNGGNGGNGGDRVNTAQLHGAESSQESKDTIRIYCWNTEFKNRFDDFYSKYTKFNKEMGTYTPVNDKGEKLPDRQEIVTLNGKKVEWIQNTNEGNVYQTKLDDALKDQKDSDNKVDLFLIEADYALKYINGDVAISVQDLGITEDEMSEMYQYTKDVATDSNTGELKGLTWQAAPGAFIYNREYAKQVLGTDDPAEVQEYVKDWATFKETAAKMKEAGIFMVSGYDDAYRTFSANAAAPWVTDKKVTIDPQIADWVKMTKEYTDEGYNNKTSLWDDAWKNGMKVDGKVFGYFLSTWGIPFTLAPNTGDEGTGKWAACEGPQAYFWGGTWICAAIDTDNLEEVTDIMRVMTCNKDCLKDITTVEQDYTNNKAGIKELIDGGYNSEVLGGQDHLSLLSAQAEKIDLSKNLSPYDQGCNEKFQGAMKAYFDGTSTYEEAIEAFKNDLTALYADLDVSGVK